MTRNPPPVPADTTAEAWHEQMRIIRSLSPQERLRLWQELNDQILAMERAAILRAHPALDETGVGLELVRRRYGDELAQACREHLARRTAISSAPAGQRSAS